MNSNSTHGTADFSRVDPQHIPELKWAIYPRGMTTPDSNAAYTRRKLISNRRKTGVPDFDIDLVPDANFEE